MPDPAATQPVRAFDVLPVLVVAPAVAWAWIRFVAPDRSLELLLIGLSVGGAATFGVTTWAWAADHAWTRWTYRVVLGALAGLGPPVAVLAAAVAGLVWRNGAADTADLLRHGAAIPAYGLLAWPSFLSFSAQCAGVGAISGAIQWAISRILITDTHRDAARL
jgi:hypothetical protein